MTRILAFLTYWLGLDKVFYWFNRKAKRIITFHNVLPDFMFVDDLPNGVSNSVSSFRSIIEEVGKQYDFSVDFFDARTCTITFDDGYLNQYEVAGNILKEKGIPAVLFVSGDLIDSNEPLQVDQLLHWTQGHYGSRALSQWVNVIWPRFLAREQIDFDFQEVAKNLPQEYFRLRLSGVSSSQLADLRARGWIVGWHTKSHLPLATLGIDALKEELEAPAEFRDSCFSYPYGSLTEVGRTAIEMIRKIGYPCAVSNTKESEENGNRFFMPRMFLSSDKYLLHFELSGCKHFLKFRRLLPLVR